MKESAVFSRIREENSSYDGSDRATIGSIGIKTIVLAALAIASGVLTAMYVPRAFESEDKLMYLVLILIASSIVSLISYFLGRFVESISHVCSIIYSLAEGVSLGFITAIAELYVPGVGYAALGATLIIFLVVTVLFRAGVIKAGRTAFAIMIALLISAVLLSIMTVVIAFVGNYTEYISISILVEVIMLLFATISLVFNFQEATFIVEAGCSKQAEWSVALGLMVTLVYIYLRVLRILLYVARIVANSRN